MDAVVLVYDITLKQSLQEIPLVFNVQEHSRGVLIILVGNKSDMNEQRQVHPKEGLKLANKFGGSFLEVSARTGHGVDKVLQQLVSVLAARQHGHSDEGHPEVPQQTVTMDAMEKGSALDRPQQREGDMSELAAESAVSSALENFVESVTQSTSSVLEDEATQPLSAAQAAIIPLRNPGVATQIAPAMEPDLDPMDEGYVESVGTSYVTSIASDILRGIMENGRRYPSYGKHNYGLPIDEEEMDRLDLQHHKYELLIGNKHFLAPIGPNPQRILDLATGTGIWALDVADMFPTAQVTGVDIARIQPAWVGTNCRFELDDIEEPWTYRKETFDFIHGRDFLYCLRDYQTLLRQCYEHLKPGGYVELACIHPLPFCDDGSMPLDSGFRQVCEKFIEASALWGTPADVPTRYAQYMRDAGFVDVSENIFKVPSCPWPKDKTLKKIGALEMMNVIEGAQGFGLRVFEKVFGWTKEQTELVMVDFRRDVKNRSYHQYCH